MSFHPLRQRRVAAAVACAAAFVAPLASAQAPPLKPGLWEVQSEREVNGQKTTSPANRMKSMPPETRARMEAMMKERGMALGPGGANRICMSKESLDSGQWQSQAQAAGCKTDYRTRTSSAWKWHASCPSMQSESDGEIAFLSPENYTVNVATTMTMHGEAKMSHMTMKGKWLGTDCGDLKPISPPKAKP